VDRPSTSQPLALTPLNILGDWMVYGLQIITRLIHNALLFYFCYDVDWSGEAAEE
jgi:hypothetical protein